MKKTLLTIVHIFLALLAFFVSVGNLRAQQVPELIPYQIVPLDPIPDCRLELGIELIHPYKIANLPEPQKEETLDIIYKRIAYEISNPNRQTGLFEIDGKLYHLIRIPYTGASSFWGWEYE